MTIRGCPVMPRRYLPGVGDLPRTGAHADELSRVREHLVQHLGRELAGEGVLLARVVATEQRDAGRCEAVAGWALHFDFDAVPESGSARGHSVSGCGEAVEHRCPGESAEGNGDPHRR